MSPPIIELKSDSDEKFKNGNIVFRITSSYARDDNTVTVYDKGMVITKEDYEKRLAQHQYSPLLYIISLPQLLAYLYGCLPFEYNTPRKETFTFWSREIGKHQWHEWFIVKIQ